MNKKTTGRKRKKKLSLHWVEEMGFNLAPTVRPASVPSVPAHHALLSGKSRGLGSKSAPTAFPS